jgi:hypothetical protein
MKNRIGKKVDQDEILQLMIERLEAMHLLGRTRCMESGMNDSRKTNDALINDILMIKKEIELLERENKRICADLRLIYSLTITLVLTLLGISITILVKYLISA